MMKKSVSVMTFKSNSFQKVGGVKTEMSPPSVCVGKTCKNYGIKCKECVQIQGRYTEYEI
jgi:hypothetical protein